MSKAGEDCTFEISRYICQLLWLRYLVVLWSLNENIHYCRDKENRILFVHIAEELFTQFSSWCWKELWPFLAAVWGSLLVHRPASSSSISGVSKLDINRGRLPAIHCPKRNLVLSVFLYNKSNYFPLERKVSDGLRQRVKTYVSQSKDRKEKRKGVSSSFLNGKSRIDIFLDV